MKNEVSPLNRLSSLSSARVGLKRTGSSLSTGEILKFDLDHARARDAVHMPFDTSMLINRLNGNGIQTLVVDSAACNREIFLKRPDLGRTLSEESKRILEEYTEEYPKKVDITLVVGDGLSSQAIHSNAAEFINFFYARSASYNWSTSPVILANQSRVALADEIGEIFKAGIGIILIGERPGLSASDSMGIYMTYEPCKGKTDAEKNCISNIRTGGMTIESAVNKLLYLINASLKQRISGVSLKDNSQFLEGSE